MRFRAAEGGYPRVMDDHDWTSFDVRARDSAVAAHVAMWLRERLPAATIKSAPDNPANQEVLHCDAAIPDCSAAQTEQAVKAALRALPHVDGPDAPAEIDFAPGTFARAA